MPRDRAGISKQGFLETNTFPTTALGTFSYFYVLVRRPMRVPAQKLKAAGNTILRRPIARLAAARNPNPIMQQPLAAMHWRA